MLLGWMSENPSCYICGNPSIRNYQNSWRCLRHQTLHMMRQNAKCAGKVSPTRQELDAMVPADMVCPSCKLTMTWTMAEGPNSISLQHNRDGTLIILCLRCNHRHCPLPGDMFYEIAPGMKWCNDCKTVKPHSEFWKRGDRPGGFQSYCVPCMGIRNEKRKIATGNIKAA